MVGVVLKTKASETVIGGVSLLERQTRMLRKAGIQEILILDPKKAPPKITGEVLLLDGSSLIDDRIPELLLNQKGEKIAAINGAFAGGARLKGENLEKFLKESLEVDLRMHNDRLLDLSSHPDYRPERRRKVPFLWIPVKGAQDNVRCKEALLDAAQNGVLDWPAWYIHRRIENWIVFRLCETPVTPNQVTVVNNLVAWVALLLFLQGHFLTGLLTAMAAGILDGVDGKLARVKQMTSKIGEFEHLFDKIYESGWYLAMAYSLAVPGDRTPYILFGFLFAANMGDLAMVRLFRDKFGRPPDDFGPFERGFRVIGGRRNTYIWTLLPFYLVGQFYWGYLAITIYSLLSLSVRVWRYSLHTIRSSSRRAALS